MPEGPSIVILREAAAKFAGRRVLRVSGNTKQDIDRLRNKTLKAVRSWGKHFLLEFSGFSVRIHFLLFGSYRIDEDKGAGSAVAGLQPRRSAELLRMLGEVPRGRPRRPL